MAREKEAPAFSWIWHRIVCQRHCAKSILFPFIFLLSPSSCWVAIHCWIHSCLDSHLLPRINNRFNNIHCTSGSPYVGTDFVFNFL